MRRRAPKFGMQHERRTDATLGRAPRSWRIVATIPGLASIPAYVDPEEQQALLEAVDATPTKLGVRLRAENDARLGDALIAEAIG